MDVPEINVTVTSVPVGIQPRKLKTKWRCKWYGDSAVLILSPYRWVFWFYDLWYALFPPPNPEQELVDVLMEHIKEISAEQQK